MTTAVRLAPVTTATVVLALTRSSVQLRACQAWAQRVHPVASCVSDVRRAVRLAEPDGLVVPVRLGPAWQDGNAALAASVLASRLGHGRVVEGDPATLTELVDRWVERSGVPLTGRPSDDPGFVAFVARQADIALERAELSVLGERFRRPREAVEEVLTSAGFADAVSALSHRLGRSREGVLVDVRAYLEEMASKQNRVVVDLWTRWARFLHGRSYRLDVDAESFEPVQTLAAGHPLVFLPSHRSNLDPYVMASVLYDGGLPLNHTLGGINMAFWPIGPLGRRVGVVFIRRSFRDNEVYRFVLQRYLGFLVSKRFNLEWYVEGSRSRTGKLLPPKLGLLGYLIDAVDELERDDVFAVPTSITYDVLPEAGEMTAESRGSVKQREGLGWLVRYARTQRGDLGEVHVRFGEPLRLSEALASFQPAGTLPGSDAARLARSKIGFEVCNRINKATPITGPSLLLFALLGVEGRALTLAEVVEVVDPVLRYARQRRIPLVDEAAGLATPAGAQRLLAFLAGHGLLEEFTGGPEPVYRIAPDRGLVAAFYRNSVLHWFVTRAIVELVLLDLPRHADGAVPAGSRLVRAGNDEAWRLRDLLKFEFFFPERREFDDALAAEVALIAPDWQDRSTAELPAVRDALLDSGLLVAHRTLRSFVESYSVVADHLVALGEAAADPDDVVGACLSLGRQLILQRQLTSDEAVSAHLFRTALKLAVHRDLMPAGRLPERRALADQLSDVRRRVDAVHDLEQEQCAAAAVRGRAS